ncbi:MULTISPECIES: TlpA disulfide reductase family protein [Flavobacteriaceae]|uniref:TlpA disulfide reductase family protein n=1 Tax=Flavobacteriaceae TaxID=49546 RepID=UPI001491E0B9|nr:MULTISPECIES: TlpA disulfide reductase family protein [Allomuricauda]MDC6367537.1 TlpA disulfide reductase family protein [Muricauda sp. AC10]
MKQLAINTYLIVLMAIFSGWSTLFANTPINAASFTVNGSVSGGESDTFIINYSSNGKSSKGTAKIEKGKFTWHCPVTDYPIMASIMVDNHYIDLPIFIENGALSLNITLDGDNMPQVHATGTPTNDEYYKKFLPLFLDKRQKSFDMMYSGTMTPTLEIKFNALRAEIDQIRKNYIPKHPNSFIAAYVLAEEYVYEFMADNSLVSVYDAMNGAIKKAPCGKAIKKHVDTYLKFKPGTKAKNISQKDMEGKLRNLEDLKGKYVLLDFWATWCGPCIADFPKLKSLLKKYREKGFEVYGVSIDKNEGKWKKFVKKSKLTWTNVIDNPASEKSAKKIYEVDAVPTKYLIGPDGKIILVQPKTKDIADFLSKKFD